ncbi:MAG: hypothetical protein JXA42_22830 [Anaerolineales bacterium]|nr:hypothetical protein [Anaerolineales bacterium]
MSGSIITRAILAILMIGLVLFTPAGVEAQEPVVRAVLFHSPSCSHCKTVIEEVLPPLQEEFGDKLVILMVDTSTDAGFGLYATMQKVYKPGEGRKGVPSLIVGDVLLVGSREIPAEFPGIIEGGLEGAGIDWPDLPGLEKYLTGNPVVEQETGGQELQHGKNELDLDKIVALVMLVVLVFTLIANGYRVWTRRRVLRLAPAIKNNPGRQNWIIPVLSIIGFYIAWYLANKEITQTSVACGPLGGCDTVQNSEYAIFFGLPMGVWGMLAYALILFFWGLVEFGVRSPGKSNPVGLLERLTPLVKLAMMAFSLFCVAFSIYLTILEAFVINATCTWCIGSAGVSAAINWAVMFDRTWLPGMATEKASQG